MNDSSLVSVAKKVCWWKSPEDVLRETDRFLCQVMTYGAAEDVIAVMKRYSADDFRRALKNAPSGLFDPRSWTYWHLALGMERGPQPRRF